MNEGREPLAAVALLALLALLVLPSAPVHAAVWKTDATPHFVLHYPSSMAGKAAGWGRQAEDAYKEISAQLGLNPKGHIPLYLYAQHREFREAAGVLPHDLVVGTSETRGGLIRLDASGVFSDARRTLRHEIAHSVLALGLGPRVDDLPLWFNEGLAQVAGQPENPAAEEEVRQARGAGTVLPLSKLAGEFPHGEGAGVAYAASYSAAAYYVKLFGWEGVRKLLAGVREGRGFSPSFREATGIDLLEFYGSWEGSLVRQGWMEWVQLFYVPAVGLVMIWAMWRAYHTVRHRKRRIIEEEEEDPDAPPDIVEPDDELDHRSGLRPNAD